MTAVPLTVMGGQAGILQGERRWGPLAGIYLAVGIAALVFGGAALLVEHRHARRHGRHHRGRRRPGADRLVGAAAPGPRAGAADAPAAPATPPAQRWATGGVLRETFHNSHALLAFFALSNADVIIARNALDEHQAGLYAGGLILTKAVLFLPQFVVVIAFPSMSRAGDDRRAHLVSLALVLGIGAGRRRSGSRVLSTLAVVFVGGSEYADLQGRLWGFAVLGTLLSLIQVMVYEVVARQHQRMVLVVWTTLLVLLLRRPVRRRADRPARRRRHAGRAVVPAAARGQPALPDVLAAPTPPRPEPRSTLQTSRACCSMLLLACCTGGACSSRAPPAAPRGAGRR